MALEGVCRFVMDDRVSTGLVGVVDRAGSARGATPPFGHFLHQATVRVDATRLEQLIAMSREPGARRACTARMNSAGY